MPYHLDYHGKTRIKKALLDLGASVNILPYSVYKQFGLGELKLTNITLSLSNISIKKSRGIVEYVLVQVDTFYYSIDFIVLDIEKSTRGINHVPIILGRPFLGTSYALINCRNGLIQHTFGNMTMEVNVFNLIKKSDSYDADLKEASVIHSVVEERVDGLMSHDLDTYYECLDKGNILFEPP